MKLTVSLIALMAFVGLSATSAKAATRYVSQNGGSFNGGSACNGQSTLSVGASNGTTYGPGDVVYLCGTITSGVVINGSGNASNSITVNFDSGAKISLPTCATICFNIQGNYVVVNGGTPCGPGTTCATNEENNPTNGNPQTGTIEATANGSGLANQRDGVSGIQSSGAHVTVQNIIVRNIYQHTQFSDGTGDSNSTNCWAVYNGTGQRNTSYITLQDSALHDCGAGFSSHNGTDFATVQRNSIFRMNWGISNGVYSAAYIGSGACAPTDLCSQGWVISDNHLGSVANWDNSRNSYHHNRIMLYAANDHVFPNTGSGGQMKNYYIYNNLFDGASGCCSTGHIFVDDPPLVNFYYFNNVHNNSGQSTGIDNALMQISGDYGSSNIFIYNNTTIGAGGNIETNVCTQQWAGSGVVFKNNVSAACYTLVYTHFFSNGTYSNNQYAAGGGKNGNNGSGIWSSGSNCFNLSCWQGLGQAGGDPGSAYYPSFASLNISSSGVPQANSPLVNAGANLSSVCGSNPNLQALCSDTSAGNTRTPTPRPASGNWTVGAYNVPGSGGAGGAAPPPNKPAPPTNLGATIQ